MIFIRIPFILLPDEEWLQVKQWIAGTSFKRKQFTIYLHLQMGLNV